MLDFKSWLKTKEYHTFKDYTGIYTSDLIEDKNFPIACEKYVIYRYLSIKNDDNQLDLFENLYSEYIGFISRRFSDDPLHD